MGPKKKRSKLAKGGVQSKPHKIDAQAGNATNRSSDVQRAPDIGEGAQKCYEIRDAGNVGVGVFATKFVPAGTLIFKESPILPLPEDLPHDATQYLEPAYARLSRRDKDRFMELRTIRDMPNRAQDPMLSMISLSAPFVMRWLKLDSNTMHHNGKSGVFNLMCRLNHSCIPNVEALGDPRLEMEAHAITDIQAGEQITKCYTNDFYYLTTAERREEKPAWGLFWECECELCTGPAARRQISDMQRRLLRHIAFLLKGHDLTAAAHKIEAPQQPMPKATEDERTTVLWYLKAALLDAEGAVLEGEVSYWYGKAAGMLCARAQDLELHELATPARANFEAWRARSVQLAALSPDGGVHCVPLRLREVLENRAAEWL